MKSVWLNDWKDSDTSVLEKLFSLNNKVLDSINILLASYKAGEETANAFVLFLNDGILYEINASHDSEQDFKGQWLPEETSIEALLFRLNKGNLGSIKASENIFDQELREILAKLMH